MTTTNTPAKPLITPEGILASRPGSLFTAKLPPNAKPGQQPKFFARILFPAAALQTAEFKAILASVVGTGRAKFGADFDTWLKEGAARSPIRKDIATKGYNPDTFAAYLNLNAFVDSKPVVVGRDGKPVMDQSALYPGCRVRASVRASAYDQQGNKGVTLYLGNVQLMGDGERLATANGDGSEFGALEPEAGASDEANDLLALVS